MLTVYVFQREGDGMSDPRIELYETYKNAIFLYLYRSTLNEHVAEDLTQDTFLKAFQSLSSFRGESSLKTWLFKIARKHIYQFQQEETKHNGIPVGFDWRTKVQSGRSIQTFRWSASNWVDITEAARKLQNVYHPARCQWPFIWRSCCHNKRINRTDEGWTIQGQEKIQGNLPWNGG